MKEFDNHNVRQLLFSVQVAVATVRMAPSGFDVISVGGLMNGWKRWRNSSSLGPAHPLVPIFVPARPAISAAVGTADRYTPAASLKERWLP